MLINVFIRTYCINTISAQLKLLSFLCNSCRSYHNKVVISKLQDLIPSVSIYIYSVVTNDLKYLSHFTYGQKVFSVMKAYK